MNGKGIPAILDHDVVKEGIWACINEHDFFKQMSNIGYYIHEMEKTTGEEREQALTKLMNYLGYPNEFENEEEITKFTESLKDLIHNTEQKILQIERDCRNFSDTELFEKYKHNLSEVLAKDYEKQLSQ
jgi:hypothetical protein